MPRTPADDKTEPPRKAWRSGQQARMSIMQVFRQAHRAKDGKVATESAGPGETNVTARSRQRRVGLSEDDLKASLRNDLSDLMTTVRLDAVVPLDDVPHVKASIVNYGFRDFSGITLAELRSPIVSADIRQALIDHEPRLIAETVTVALATDETEVHRRQTITVSAEMMGDPVDVAVDFDAQVDVGGGKLKMSDLRVRR